MARHSEEFSLSITLLGYFKRKKKDGYGAVGLGLASEIDQKGTFTEALWIALYGLLTLTNQIKNVSKPMSENRR